MKNLIKDKKGYDFAEKEVSNCQEEFENILFFLCPYLTPYSVHPSQTSLLINKDSFLDH